MAYWWIRLIAVATAVHHRVIFNLTRASQRDREASPFRFDQHVSANDAVTVNQDAVSMIVGKGVIQNSPVLNRDTYVTTIGSDSHIGNECFTRRGQDDPAFCEA